VNSKLRFFRDGSPSGLVVQVVTMSIVFIAITATGAWFNSKHTKLQEKRIDAINAAVADGVPRIMVNEVTLASLTARIDKLEKAIGDGRDDIIGELRAAMREFSKSRFTSADGAKVSKRIDRIVEANGLEE